MRNDQSGQSLVVVLLAMAVIIGITAFAIDVAGWYQKHHQAQVAADAGALAAANCLANAGAPNNTCTTNYDAGAATTVAVNYAQKNGITILPKDVAVNTASGTVRVTAKTDAPAFFARLFGIDKATVVSGATAKYSGSTDCASADQTLLGTGACTAIYAGNSTCGSDTGVQVGINSTGAANVSVTGTAHSEGAMQVANSTGASYFTVGQQCPGTISGPNGTVQISSSNGNNNNYATKNVPYPYPVDFRNYFDCQPSGIAPVSPDCYKYTCTTTGCTASSAADNWSCVGSTLSSPGNCTQLPDLGVSGQTDATTCTDTTTCIWVPKYCTEATTEPLVFNSPPKADQVWCAVGNTGIKNGTLGTANETAVNPISWNGSITFDVGGSGTCNTTSDAIKGTYIAGSIKSLNTSGVLCLAPADTPTSVLSLPNNVNDLLFYATGPDLSPTACTTTQSFCPNMSFRQKMTWWGDMFDPYGTIQLGTTGTTSTGEGTGGGSYTSKSGMLEGFNVFIQSVSLNLTGGGSNISGYGGSSTPSNSLLTQ